MLLLLGFFAVFLLYPLWASVIKAFYPQHVFTLEYFVLALSRVEQWQVLLRSINIALGASLLSFLIGSSLAFLSVRYEFPGKRIAAVLFLLPLLLPPFVGAIGFRQLTGRFGSINLLLLDLGIISQPLDFAGEQRVWAIIVLQALHFFPLFYLTVSGSLQRLDSSLEEAAVLCGADRLRLFRAILFPLLLPAISAAAALTMISSLADLGTPLLFDERRVLAVQIFQALTDLHENSIAYALALLLSTFGLAVFIGSSLLVAQYPDLGVRLGRGLKVRQAGPGLSLVIWSFIALVVGAAFLPHLGVLLLAFSKQWFFSILPSEYSLQHFVAVFQHPLTLGSLRTSLLLSLASVVLTAALGLTIVWLSLRTKVRAKFLLEGIVMLPLAVPGLLFAMGYLDGFAGTLLDPRVNPLPLLVIAYTVRKLPFMTKAVHVGLQQVSPTLEEAARCVGASAAQTLRHITFPLMKVSIFSGAILCFAFAMIEVSDSLLLALEERYYPISKALYALTLRPDGLSLACALAVLVMCVVCGCLLIGARVSGKSLGELFSPTA